MHVFAYCKHKLFVVFGRCEIGRRMMGGEGRDVVCGMFLRAKGSIFLEGRDGMGV